MQTRSPVDYETVACEACGAALLPNRSGVCENCGARLRRTSRTRTDEVRAGDQSSGPAQHGGAHRDARPAVKVPTRVRNGSAELRGTVNQFERRNVTRSRLQQSRSFELWSFVLHVDEYEGGLEVTYIVDAEREDNMFGTLHNGEQVRVQGELYEGRMQASVIFSETHLAFVGPSTGDTLGSGWLSPLMVFLALMVVLALVLPLLLSHLVKTM